jgi:hypothetical protein
MQAYHLWYGIKEIYSFIVNKGNFTFLQCRCFILSSGLIALAKLSTTEMTRNGDSEQFILFLILGRRCSVFLLFMMIEVEYSSTGWVNDEYSLTGWENFLFLVYSILYQKWKSLDYIIPTSPGNQHSMLCLLIHYLSGESNHYWK